MKRLKTNKDSASFIPWKNVSTHTQKRRAIAAVMTEITKLRKSPALRDILNWDTCTIISRPNFGDAGRRYVMQKDGKIWEYSMKSGYGGIVVEAKKLPELIEQFSVYPSEISDVRKQIEA